MFPYITLSVECISKFLSAWSKHLEEWKPFDLSSSLNVRCCKLKHKKRNFFSTQRSHDQSYPFNNCKAVKALLSAFNDEFRNLFVIDLHEILWSAFECIETDFYFKVAIEKSSLMEVALLPA